jgi:hypothetical protein
MCILDATPWATGWLSYRVKLAFFLLCAIAILFFVDTAYQGLNTLSRLNYCDSGFPCGLPEDSDSQK